jgi:hypothetical protein
MWILILLLVVGVFCSSSAISRKLLEWIKRPFHKETPEERQERMLDYGYDIGQEYSDSYITDAEWRGIMSRIRTKEDYRAFVRGFGYNFNGDGMEILKPTFKKWEELSYSRRGK